MQVSSVIVLFRFVVNRFRQTQRIPLEELPFLLNKAGLLGEWLNGEIKGLTHSEGEIVVLWQGSSVAGVPEGQGKY